MPGVTVSASYGAGGDVVAAAVATQLGLPMLDRAISSQVATALHTTAQEPEADQPHRSFTERFFAVLSPLAGGALGAGTDAGPVDPDVLQSDAFREQAEKVLREAIIEGAVVLGRGGAAALRGDPEVLRVRLFGTPEARMRQAVQLTDVDEDTARKRMHEVDSAREHYLRRLYHVGSDDPELFHLHIDSTVLPLAAVAELIVYAYRALVA